MNKNIIIKICLIFSLFSSLLITNEVNCSTPTADFSSPEFEINVSDFTPMGRDIVEGDSLKTKSENLLLEIIEILMVSIWVISLLVISIGAWYMIFYNWKEDFLTKWRNMIYTGLLALLIALSSFYIINLIRYILYN